MKNIVDENPKNRRTHSCSDSLRKSSKDRASRPDTSSTVADHSGRSSSDQACIVYKFQSRPPYEGFVLILIVVVVVVLLLWWLNTKLQASDQ